MREESVPEPPTEHDEKAWNAAYRTVRHRFHSMLELVDPSPMPKNRRLDDETFQQMSEEHRAQVTDEEWAERHRRLLWLVNQLIDASTFALLPRDTPRFQGVGIDGTLVKSHSRPFRRRPGTRARRGKRAEIAVHSVDPDAGYDVRPTDR